MNELKNLLIALRNDEGGAGATEYVILLILIACVAVGVVQVFGETVEGKFDDASESSQEEIERE
ncbi:MAG: Flp family type IVb pilin [Myxococcota bacterium]